MSGAKVAVSIRMRASSFPNWVSGRVGDVGVVVKFKMDEGGTYVAHWQIEDATSMYVL